MSEYNTVFALSFTFFHDSKKPNVIENVQKISYAIFNQVASMTDEEILHRIDFGETINAE